MPYFTLPPFLVNRVDPAAYNRWLINKAQAHVQRDKKRFAKSYSVSRFKELIHAAVLASEGNDFYTGLPLAWEQISKYDNTKSSQGKGKYLREFDKLPTVDHEHLDGEGLFTFRICSWLTNDCKNRLSHQELIEFCTLILANHSYKTG